MDKPMATKTKKTIKTNSRIKSLHVKMSEAENTSAILAILQEGLQGVKEKALSELEYGVLDKLANERLSQLKGNLEVVPTPQDLDSLFGNRNSLGYVQANASIADLSVSDVGSWIETKIDSSRAALSTAVLAFSAYSRVATAENVEKLAERISASRTCGKDIVSLGKAMSSFEERGLNIANVRDIYGLRDVRSLALGNNAEASALAITELNAGKSPRAVKNQVAEEFPDVVKARKSPVTPAEKPTDAPVIRRKDTQVAFDALVKSFDQVAKWPKDVQDAAVDALAKVIKASRN